MVPCNLEYPIETPELAYSWVFAIAFQYLHREWNCIQRSPTIDGYKSVSAT